MRTIQTATAVVALLTPPALAQDSAASPSAPKAVGPMDMSKMTPEQLHKHCAMMMGGEMRGRPKHDHSADKLGHSPAMKPPSDGAMKAMHDKCAAAMAKKAPSAPAKR